jgi:hypothetical protein
MPKKNDAINPRITRCELATILAALRFHQDENLKGSSEIPDQLIKEIATDGGLFKPPGFDEVGKLCERLNLDGISQSTKGLVIEPPPKDDGDEPLFRVVYVIDVNSPDPLGAARQAHRFMASPESLPPVLEVIDHRDKTVSIDLSQEARS